MCRAPFRFHHPLSYRQCPIRPCGAPSPRGEGCDTRIPSPKKAAKPPPYKPSPHGEGGPRQRCSGVFVCSTNAPLFPCTTICLSYHSHPIRPFGAPSPRGEGCDTRISSSRKAAKPLPYNKAPSTSVGMTFKEDG